MKIAIVGLGKMGRQIAQKLSQDNHSIVVVTKNPEHAKQTVEFGGTAIASAADLPSAFGADERIVVWLMVPSDAVDDVLKQFTPYLLPNSIIIDGGNSNFNFTKQRAQDLASKNINMLDCGTSGGVWGYKNGFSMMIGGSNKAFTYCEPIFKSLSAPNGSYKYFGPSGAGHFIKMVHNGIEYGMMQSLAEGYQVLHQGPYPNLDLSQIADVWQHGSVVSSWLNELTRDVLQQNPTLADIDGFVAESGEARWTLQTAKEIGISLPAIEAAFNVRLESQQGNVSFATKLLAAMRNKFGGHNVNKL